MHKARIITGVLLVSSVIPALFMLPNTLWAILMLLVALIGLQEWTYMGAFSGFSRKLYLGVMAILGLSTIVLMNAQSVKEVFSYTYTYAQPLLLLSALFWVLVIPFWLAKQVVVVHRPVMMALLGFLLLAPLWLSISMLQASSPLMLLILLVPIWLADSAAYFTGKRFGKHKLAPSISPGKTWEGVAGAMLAVTVYAAMLLMAGLVSSWAVFVVMWAIAILGIIGDLFESMIKRQANIKDSGNILPGHGGVLDRIDGLISSLPVAVLIVTLLGVELIR